MAHDKVVCQALLSASGFPVPRIAAIYHRHRSVRGAASLRTPADLEAFLRSACEFPCFGKPVDGMYSVGSIRLDAYDPDTDRLTIHTGDRVSVATFVANVAPYARRGYLLQEVKRPHERMREVGGDRIACVRVVVLVDADGPEVFRTLWKLPTGPQVADNFWRPGNMLGDIDMATGHVTRVVTGVGLQQREVERHPDTGYRMPGFVIPHWAEVKALCLEAAATVWGIKMQAWDIGVCPEGPVVIEVNVGGDFNLPQVAQGRGLLDDRFRKFLADAGYRPLSTVRVALAAPVRRFRNAVRAPVPTSERAAAPGTRLEEVPALRKGGEPEVGVR
jgi:hypothetical protein